MGVLEGTPQDAVLRAERLVRVQGVERRFDDVLALRGIDLEVGAGEVHALLGPNGAGKTTLLRTLQGLVDPHAGWARIGGLDTSLHAEALRAVLGVVPAGDRSFYQ